MKFKNLLNIVVEKNPFCDNRVIVVFRFQNKSKVIHKYKSDITQESIELLISKLTGKDANSTKKTPFCEELKFLECDLSVYGFLFTEYTHPLSTVEAIENLKKEIEEKSGVDINKIHQKW